MLGKLLKYMRISKNLKQDDIASQLNIRSNALSQYETDSRQPTFETIKKIADICNFDIKFIDRDTNKEIDIKELNRKDI